LKKWFIFNYSTIINRCILVINLRVKVENYLFRYEKKYFLEILGKSIVLEF